MLKNFLWIGLAAGLLGGSPGIAIPNAIFGPIAQADSPLNGADVTDEVLAALAGDGELPGRWVAEAGMGGAEVSHLLARPLLFGQEVVILRAVHRGGGLERVEATFADAGSYFGYFDDELPDGLSKREREAAVRQILVGRQQSFAGIYERAESGLRAALAEVADKARPRSQRVGSRRMLRAETEEWRWGDLVMRLFAVEPRLVRLELFAGENRRDSWMDRAYEGESDRERLARLAATVERDDDGVVRIRGIEPVPQGYRPYCGLNTLVMAARHLGMTLDEDWLAAAGGFRNTGSAAGSNMVKLYGEVAREAGLSMERSSRLDEFAVRGALAEGRPVVVWRRFSWERNRLHDRVAAGREALPDPSDPAEQSSWPGEDAPLHASVLTGFDRQRGEWFFLESWSGDDRPRRMTFEEMAATCYLCFVFDE